MRDQIRLTDDEIAAFLEAPRKLQLATLNGDGSPHLSTMFYAMVDDRVAFWTYRKSQKAVNLIRDPRVAVLVEDGMAYEELAGVSITGTAEHVTDPDRIRAIGRAVYVRYIGNPDDPHLDGFLDHQVQRRDGFIIHPETTASWDHAKLAAGHTPSGAAGAGETQPSTAEGANA
ncbi:MAG: pyridoxamine 5'-phosphate oxidase family protein [Nitriliruptorales bacterium]|nr:pyridoxamine 5'-phosphate oxidase family protein [Nitriliruptorales bacterium]